MCHTVQMDVFLFSARHVRDTFTAQAARKEGAAADVRPPTNVYLARTLLFFFPPTVRFTAGRLNERPSCSGSRKVQNVHTGPIWEMNKGYILRLTSAAAQMLPVSVGAGILNVYTVYLGWLCPSIVSKQTLPTSNGKQYLARSCGQVRRLNLGG